MEEDILSQILTRKRLEVEKFKHTLVTDQEHPIHAILQGKKRGELAGNFAEGLRAPGLSIITEIKWKSPSAGMINDKIDPMKLAKLYEEGGASCISVLTDEEGFGGSIDDLKNVTSHASIPVLRKDFVIDPVQIAEAVHSEASAILLIVAALKEELKEYLERADKMGIDALVEVHNEKELMVALTAGAKIIGVNNRDLKTFKVDLEVAKRLIGKMPKGVIAVAESGIRSPSDAKEMKDAGYDAVLVGELLMKAKSPEEMIRSMR